MKFKLLLFLLFITPHLRGQDGSVQSIQNEVKVSNQIAESLYGSQRCMQSFYERLLYYQQKNSLSINYNNANCIKQPSFTDASLQKSKELIRMNYLYQQLYEINNTIVAEIRLESYKSDRGAGLFRKTEKMELTIDSIREIRNSFKEKVYKGIKTTSTSPITKAYYLMVETAAHEEKILKHLEEKYYSEQSESLNEDLIITSYLETEDLIENLKKIKNLNHPTGYHFKAFIESVERIQKLKKRTVDLNGFEEKKNTEYIQKFYQSFINSFNNDLLSSHQNYIQSITGGKNSFIQYPKYIPSLWLKVKELSREFEPFYYRPNKDITFTDPPLKPHLIDNQTFHLLNNIVLSLNQRTFSIYRTDRSLRQFTSSLERLKAQSPESQKNYSVHFRYEVELPEIDFAFIKDQSKKLLPEYQTTIIAAFTDLQEMMYEYEWTCEYLKQYFENKEFLEKGFSDVDKKLERLHDLSILFEKNKISLYRYIESLYNSYKHGNVANPWVKTYESLTEAIKNTSSVVDSLHKQYYLQKTSSIDTTTMGELRKNLIVKQSNNMQGIKKLGRTHGHCPYTPYENIPDKMERILLQSKQTDKNISEGKYSKYKEIEHQYNEIVSDYNKYVYLGLGEVETAKNDPNRPVFLLSQLTKFSPTIPDQPNPITRNQEIQPLIKEQELNPPKDDLPVEEIKEPRKKKKDDSQIAIIRDTIYIEHYRTDTIYLNESDEDFTSFENAAYNNLVFLLDISGSMNHPEKLPVLKESILYLTSLMREEDEISIILYSGKAKAILKPTPATHQDEIEKIIKNLAASGKTNFNAGLKLAYKVADENYKRGGNNRLILATDGEIRMGENAFNLAENFSKEDIQISVLLFGGKNSENLKKLAQKGKGNYISISKHTIKQQLIREAKSKRIR